MNNFDEIELVVKVQVVIKKGKSKDLVNHIHSRFGDFLDVYYANENLEVMAFKLEKETT